MPSLISLPGLLVGVLAEFLAFSLGGTLDDPSGPLYNLRHLPVWLTVVGLGAWFARRDPARWIRAVLLHVPLIFVLVTLAFEFVAGSSIGHRGVIDGSVGAWGGIVLGAVGMGIGALAAAWLEPGARARRASLRRGDPTAS